MIRIGRDGPAIAIVLAAIFSLAAPASAQTTLRLLSGWTPNNPNVPNIETVYIKNVEQASNGQLKIVRSGPEVASPFEQLQPVSAGVFDILFTTPAYHQAQTGVAQMFDAIKGDIDARHSSGLVQWADDYYRKKFGVSILAVHSAPGNHFVLREPLKETKDKALDGLKIRTTPTFDGVVRLLGGTPVNMPPSDAYAAMQKGVLDGIAFPAFASADYKLYEVGKYMTRPVFGLTNVLMMINVAKLNALPPDLRKIVLDEGRKIEVIGKAALDKIEVQDNEIMLKNGVKPVNFDAATTPKLNELYNEGVLRTASRSTPDDAKAMYDLAKSKNMLNQ
jgi:TRAP-type C4-dicarboxylate transport system substrate-binding protein